VSQRNPSFREVARALHGIQAAILAIRAHTPGMAASQQVRRSGRSWASLPSRRPQPVLRRPQSAAETAATEAQAGKHGWRGVHTIGSKFRW